jgi:hypothetical protein
VQSLDEILVIQNTFLDECLKECLLTNFKLLDILTQTTQACGFFANMIKRLHFSIQDDADNFRVE